MPLLKQYSNCQWCVSTVQYKIVYLFIYDMSSARVAGIKGEMKLGSSFYPSLVIFLTFKIGIHIEKQHCFYSL